MESFLKGDTTFLLLPSAKNELQHLYKELII